MLTGQELALAIAAVLASAMVLGALLHWLWRRLALGRSGDGGRLAALGERLHEAETAREAAELARQEAEARLARHEADRSERIADIEARLNGVAAGSEGGDGSEGGAGNDAAQERELSETSAELEAMHEELSNARQRIGELEAELARLRGTGA